MRPLARSFFHDAFWRSLQTGKAFRLPARQRLISTSLPTRPGALQRTARASHPHQPLKSSSPLRAQFRRFGQRRKYSSGHSNPKPNPNPTANLGSPDAGLSISQRFRKLSREYGWSALGIYLLLSALDFPFCFLAVRLIGTDRIGHWEHVIVHTVQDVIWYPISQVLGKETHPKGQEAVAVPAEGAPKDAIASPTEQQDPAEWSWGVEAAQEANKKDATIWTQLALAYAVHKSFIFLRVPLTAAVTPKVVRTLRGWGWDIGKRRPKP